MKFYMGVDPDADTTAVALIGESETGSGPLIGVWLINLLESDGASPLGMVNAAARFFCGNDIPSPEADVVAVAVEGQEIVYTAQSGRNPRDVAMLGPISGAVCCGARIRYPNSRIYMPKPAAWKGQKPKSAHQALTYTALGLESKAVGKSSGKYMQPVIPDDVAAGIVGIEAIKPAAWKHLGDAIGLAQYAQETHRHWLEKSAVVEAKLSELQKKAEAKKAELDAQDSAAMGAKH